MCVASAQEPRWRTHSLQVGVKPRVADGSMVAGDDLDVDGRRNRAPRRRGSPGGRRRGCRGAAARAGGQRGGVDGPNGGVRVGGEGDVDVLGQWGLVAHEREGEVGVGVPTRSLVLREAEPGVGRDRRRSAATPAGYRRGTEVVETPSDGAIAVGVDGLDAVAVGSSRKAP